MTFSTAESERVLSDESIYCTSTDEKTGLLQPVFREVALTHRDKFFCGGRVNRHGIVEVFLRRTHF